MEIDTEKACLGRTCCSYVLVSKPPKGMYDATRCSSRRQTLRCPQGCQKLFIRWFVEGEKWSWCRKWMESGTAKASVLRYEIAPIHFPPIDRIEAYSSSFLTGITLIFTVSVAQWWETNSGKQTKDNKRTNSNVSYILVLSPWLRTFKKCTRIDRSPSHHPIISSLDL